VSDIIRKYIVGSEHYWIWFICTVFFGATPLILSVLLNISRGSEDIMKFYKLVDVVGWGLTMCVANLNLVGGKKFDLTRGTYLVISFAGLFIFTVCLVIVELISETAFFFDILLHGMLVISILLSFSANKYIRTTSK
jgi:hypothetical protein